jgi:DNA-binding PadR family transcriptional regulator
MSLPLLTHLQFLVLSHLIGGEDLSGRYLRERLAERGARKTGPSFYQLMARLEDGGFVEGWYDQKVIDGQLFKERRYRITGDGFAAVQALHDFYFEDLENVRRLGLLGG